MSVLNTLNETENSTAFLVQSIFNSLQIKICDPDNPVKNLQFLNFLASNNHIKVTKNVEQLVDNFDFKVIPQSPNRDLQQQIILNRNLQVENGIFKLQIADLERKIDVMGKSLSKSQNLSEKSQTQSQNTENKQILEEEILQLKKVVKKQEKKIALLKQIVSLNEEFAEFKSKLGSDKKEKSPLKRTQTAEDWQLMGDMQGSLRLE